MKSSRKKTGFDLTGLRRQQSNGVVVPPDYIRIGLRLEIEKEFKVALQCDRVLENSMLTDNLSEHAIRVLVDQRKEALDKVKEYKQQLNTVSTVR